MSSKLVTLSLLVAALCSSAYGLFRGEEYAKDPWFIPVIVALFLTAKTY